MGKTQRFFSFSLSGGDSLFRLGKEKKKKKPGSFLEQYAMVCFVFYCLRVVEEDGNIEEIILKISRMPKN